MKKALVIGATGTIGRAVTSIFKNAGYETIETSRNSTQNINIDSSDSVNEFFNNYSGFDVIICAAGQASFGSLNKLDENDYLASFNSKLLGQIRLVKSGLSSLKQNGKIILTGGMLAYQPWPETSAIATVNAGLEGFVKAVNKELEDKKVFIVHPPLIAETAEYMGMDTDPWPKAINVGEIYLRAADDQINNEVIFLNGYSPK